MAFLLQIILPLILFFIGFSTVALDRENGTLVLLAQGAQWKEILFGKTLGLFLVAQLFFFPVLLMVFLGLFVFSTVEMDASLWLRIGLLCVSHLSFLFVISALTIAVSARSKQAKNALLKLLVFWLFLWYSCPSLRKPLGTIISLLLQN